MCSPKQGILKLYKIPRNNCRLWTQQCSLSRQPCFSPTTELCLMDLCLPEESEVVFLCWTRRRDGGPPSIHHLISGYYRQKQSGRLCAPVCQPVLIVSFSIVLCFVLSPAPSLLSSAASFILACCPVTVLWWCSVRYKSLQHQWNKRECHSHSNPPRSQHAQVHWYMYAVVPRVHLHAMQQIITSSLTATSHFPNDATEHEKGWSSRSSNGAE